MSILAQHVRLLCAGGLALALAAALMVAFTAARLRDALVAFGDDLPVPGMLLVTSSGLAWLLPALTLCLMLLVRAPARRGATTFAAGALCVLIALAWVGLGALLPLARLQGET